MRDLHEFRSGRPAFYPDQSVYAEYACAEFDLAFCDLDGGTGLVFSVASGAKIVHFGAGRCSWYPQNNATASTLASDKYFTDAILRDAGIRSLGGEYFFLHDRHRAHRGGGHERDDALTHFRHLGAKAFVKPLSGSRGDFAQILGDEASFLHYLGEVSKYYDSILVQPIVSGTEYRVLLLDDEVVYSARKRPPFVVGDGISSLRDLLDAHNEALRAKGLSPVTMSLLASDTGDSLDIVPAKGGRWAIPGRMNLSAGAQMVIERPRSEAIFDLANKAARALGLRVAAVDIFGDIDGEADAMRVIEVNANPSIRLLEEAGRSDLILKIWHHTFFSLGLLTR
jgi:hypothetical protein